MADALGLGARAAGNRGTQTRAAGGLKPALRAAILLLIAAIALVLGYKYAIAPAARPSDVHINAPAMIDASAARDRVLAALAGKSLLFADLAGVEAACEADPRVLSAEARRVFPGALSVNLEARVPVAIALSEEGGRTLPAFIDAEGVIFMRDPEAARTDLPVISGMRFDSAGEGAKLPAALGPLLRGLASAQSGLLGSVSEIRVVARPTGEVELLLYLIDAEIPVRTDADLGDDDLRTAALVLDVLKRRGGADGASEVDLRADAMVFKSKEDPS